MNNGKIAVIGAGKWGQAPHFALNSKQECFITSRTKRDIKNFVPLDFALSCEYLIIAIPAQEIKTWLKEVLDDLIANSSKDVDATIEKLGLKQVSDDGALFAIIDEILAANADKVAEYKAYRDWETDRKSTRLNSSHITRSRMPSSA